MVPKTRGSRKVFFWPDLEIWEAYLTGFEVPFSGRTLFYVSESRIFSVLSISFGPEF